jgi:hypothetical protein
MRRILRILSALLVPVAFAACSCVPAAPTAADPSCRPVYARPACSAPVAGPASYAPAPTYTYALAPEAKAAIAIPANVVACIGNFINCLAHAVFPFLP